MNTATAAESLGPGRLGDGRNLGTAWRWLPCEFCGHTASRRVAVLLPDGWFVFCAIRAACDARRGR